MTDLLLNFHASTDNICKITKGISDGIATFKPAPEKWSILEIVEHLIISDKSSYISMLKGGPEKTEQQNLETQIRFNNLELNVPTGLIAPESAKPTGKFATLEDAVDNFIAVRKKIQSFAETNELDCMATGFEHPRLGWLTRREWIRFATWHANHHARQIEGLINATAQTN